MTPLTSSADWWWTWHSMHCFLFASVEGGSCGLVFLANLLMRKGIGEKLGWYIAKIHEATDRYIDRCACMCVCVRNEVCSSDAAIQSSACMCKCVCVTRPACQTQLFTIVWILLGCGLETLWRIVWCDVVYFLAVDSRNPSLSSEDTNR